MKPCIASLSTGSEREITISRGKHKKPLHATILRKDVSVQEGGKVVCSAALYMRFLREGGNVRSFTATCRRCHMRACFELLNR